MIARRQSGMNIFLCQGKGLGPGRKRQRTGVMLSLVAVALALRQGCRVTLERAA